MSNLPIGDCTDITVRNMKLARKWTKANCNRPDIISHYNTNMGGVDLADKKIMTYKWHMKGIKWPLKVFWYI